MGRHGDSKTTYKQEFFDREYSAKEAYGRLWGFTKKYRFRIYLGVLCGMLTAGTLLPLFQVIQPALDKVETAKVEVAGARERVPPAKVEAPATKQERKVLKEYGKFKKFAQKLGFELQDENEALGAPLLFAILVIVPLAAMARCAFLFLNKYCLSWAALHTVKDIRCSILRHIQEQSAGSAGGRGGAVRDPCLGGIHHLDGRPERHAADARAAGGGLPALHVSGGAALEAHPQVGEEGA